MTTTGPRCRCSTTPCRYTCVDYDGPITHDAALLFLPQHIRREFDVRKSGNIAEQLSWQLVDMGVYTREQVEAQYGPVPDSALKFD